MTPRLNDVRRVPAPAPAPESSESDGNAALMAAAVSDAGDGGGAEVDVSGAPRTTPPIALYGTLPPPRSQTPPAHFCRPPQRHRGPHDAVSEMMDDRERQSFHVGGVRGTGRMRNQLDMDTGERPSREPPGQALAGLLKKLRSKTEDTPPQPAPPPQDTDGDGEPDATDTDDDNDGVVDQDDNAPQAILTTVTAATTMTPAPTRGPVDLSRHTQRTLASQRWRTSDKRAHVISRDG